MEIITVNVASAEGPLAAELQLLHDSIANTIRNAQLHANALMLRTVWKYCHGTEEERLRFLLTESEDNGLEPPSRALTPESLEKVTKLHAQHTLG